MIDESLREKISENEEKVKKLFKFKTGTKNKKSNKTNNEVKKGNIYKKSKINKLPKNASLKKINSFKENKENQKNYINLELTPIIKSNINSSTITYNKLDSYIKPKVKNPVVKSHYNNNKKSFEKENKYKPKIKIKYKELDSFININNSKAKITTTSENKIISNKIKKIKNRANSICNRTDREVIKYSLIKKNSFFNNIDTLSTSTSRILLNQKISSNSNKSFDFNLTYERFIENESKKNERLSKIKKKREKFENKIYPHQPRINQKSKSITKSIKDGFLIRLEKYQKKQIEREELLRKSILKDEFEKVNKTNFLMIQKKLKKKNTNVSMDKTYNSKTITESINKLLDWEKKRKEKIENEIKKQDLIEKNGHIPKINKSKNIPNPNEKNIIKRIFDRLYYSNRRIIGFKKEIKEITEESTPKFTAKLSKTKSQPNIFCNLKKIISYPNEIESENKNNYKNENKKEKRNININIEENINNIKIEKFDDIDDDDLIIKNKEINKDNISNNDYMNDDKINNNKELNSDRKTYENELKHENDTIKKEDSNKQKNIIVVIRKNKSKVDIKNCS